MHVLAVLQARMSSTRLPGKVLKNILGKSMIMWQIEREMRVSLIDKIVVATSTDYSDDILAEVLEKNDVSVYRGSLNNVLDRYYSVATLYNPDHVVRITGDCPLVDPDVINKVILEHIEHDADYTTNCSPPSWPDGLDVEVMKMSTLKKTWEESELPSELEHVTPFIRRHPNRFKIHNVVSDIDLSELRWTVDEKEDFEFVKDIYENLHFINSNFKTKDILDYLKNNPEKSNINSKYTRNKGSKSSLIKDDQYLQRSKK
jgi:spore coat polysaccharide biosynthesis protein SpsF (cytidylyltransferase family)